MSRKRKRRPGETTAGGPETGRPGEAAPSSRQQRLLARAAEAKRAKRRRRVTRATVAAVVVAAAVAGGTGLYGFLTEPATWQTLADQGNAHLPGPESTYDGYNSDPPTSGPHAPTVPAWGVHARPIPKALQVHALEDGGVLVQYNCPAGCPDLVAKLDSIIRRHRRQVILAPYPGMPHRIALTAWTRLDAFDELDEARIVRFIEKFRGVDHHR